jgi:TfoX/Sxy family transcriptional regulator of competence genes
MSTQKETAEFILQNLRGKDFSVKPMFGEYALYADQKTVGFICDNTLFVKIVKESLPLEEVCEKGPAYPGSKPYYIIDESMYHSLPELPDILRNIAKHLPAKKK